MTLIRRDLKQLLAAIGEQESFEAVKPGWDESMRTLPETTPLFLDRGHFRTSREWCGLDASIEPLLDAASTRIMEDGNLFCLAWHCRRILFDYGQNASFSKWPTLEKVMGTDLCGIFYMLVALDIVPLIRPIHAAWGIPESITRDTCLQVRSFCHTYQLFNGGHSGTPCPHLAWLRNYVNGDKYFRLGRLELRLRPHESDLTVFRRHGTNDTVALRRTMPFVIREDLFDPARGKEELRAVPVPSLSLDELMADTSYEGYPISPFGYGFKQKVILSPDEWRPVFAPGDTMMDMHIPAGGGMTPEACRDSIHRSMDFFRRYFPDEPAAAYRCNSWIFNPQLEFLLPAESNLVRFMRELYLFPLSSRGDEGVETIFSRRVFDLKTAPRKTTLQRAVAEHLEQGNLLRNGGMFFLTEDISHYGTQFYRRTWNPRQWRGIRVLPESS
ncbi:MAG: hypothetical protein C0404_14450 [Verrucomicrobia bacterium]|nr:hypothetical protein [Verrucomicrobiota bacterium]